MKNLKSVLGLAFLTVAIGFSSCTQDETMNELMDNTEISSPSDPNDGKTEDSPINGGG